MKFAVILLVTVMNLSFAKANCEKQAMVAAQGLVDANPGVFQSGHATLETVTKNSLENQAIYTFTSNNDGYIEVRASSFSGKDCYVHSVRLFMP